MSASAQKAATTADQTGPVNGKAIGVYGVETGDVALMNDTYPLSSIYYKQNERVYN